MASDSSTPTILPNSFSVPIIEKLTKMNYRLWQAQIKPAICSAQLEDLLTVDDRMLAKTIAIQNGDSTTNKANPEYTKWVTRDQALLGYILASLSQDVLMSVATHTSSVVVWSDLVGMFGACTRAQTVNTCIVLAMTKKGATTMAEYYTKMKNLADKMAASGQSLSDEEFVAYILTGLDDELYNLLVSSIVTRVELISPSEHFSQMLSYELHLEKQAGGGYSLHSSANTTTWGRGGSYGHGSSNNNGHGLGRSQGSGRGSGSVPFPSREGYTNTNT
jgi:uncharacterized membrane protein YgcG